MSTRTIIGSALAIVIVLGTHILAEEARGEGVDPSLVKICQDCHGIDGVSSIDFVPTIAGISAPVIIDELLDFRDGDRTCAGLTTMAMCGVAQGLTDKQIEALAEIFAAMKFKAAVQEFDAEKAAAGRNIHEEKCDRCHSAGGSEPYDDASILAGQWLPYLQSNLSQFANGEREPPDGMGPRIEQLSEADREALAHYYASQQ